MPKPSPSVPARTKRNPFEYGGELANARLVDRQDEVETVIRTVENGGKLFLIGPRRYGKTSILAAAEHRLTAEGTVVLRYDAETYESIGVLAEALLAGAARQFTGNLEKAGEIVKRVFAHFSPSVAYNFAEQKISVTLGTATNVTQELPLLTDVLNAIDRLAGERGVPAAIVIDEFQHVIEEGGETAERQIRSVVQRHHHLAYVFAGSKTRMLADMTSDPSRAFWKLGDRYFIGPVPRQDFLAFLRTGFENAGFATHPDGLVHILDVAEDVPYNVQQLANMCWEMLRVAPSKTLTPAFVDEALGRVVAREQSAYVQLWNSLTRTQKTILKAVLLEAGTQLRAAATLARYGVAGSTMQRTLTALDDKGIVREEENNGGIRLRLEDPFLGAWIRRAQGL